MNQLKRKAHPIITLLIFIVFVISSRNVYADELTIGFITDWEYATRDQKNKRSTSAPKYLKNAVSDLNKKKPDIMIGGGDYISGNALSRSKAKEQLKSINKIFKKTKTDNRYYLLGNHDLRSLRLSDVTKTLNIDEMKKVVDKDGFRLILLDTNFRSKDSKHYSNDGFVLGYLPPSELQWLDEQITASPYPVIVFSHHSPIDIYNRIDLINHNDTRAVLEKTGKVAAVISGHRPTQLHTELNGVHYIIINNLTNQKARRTYAYIQASVNGSDVRIDVRQYGSIKRHYTADTIFSPDLIL